MKRKISNSKIVAEEKLNSSIVKTVEEKSKSLNKETVEENVFYIRKTIEEESKMKLNWAQEKNRKPKS